QGAAYRNELIVRGYVEKLNELKRRSAEARLPAVLLTHLTVEGTEVGPHRISPRDDIVAPRSAFPNFELSVIGHIHKPERLGGAPFYYVGALDRMDMGERYYEPRVLLADLGPAGLRAEPLSLPLDPTPFEEVVAASEEELRLEHARIENPALALV